MRMSRKPVLRARLAVWVGVALWAGFALTGLAATGLGAPGAALAQEPARAAPRADGPAAGGAAAEVVACESLVALRQLMARAGEDRGAVAALVPQEPRCRALPRAEIGAVAHRAMVGGAPYECLTVGASPACLWVLP